MQPIQLFAIASEQAHWLSLRQSVVAGNIANVNTSGYAAREVEPFESVLQDTGIRMATTHPAHLADDSMRSSVKTASIVADTEVLPSGNSVNLPDEIAKTSEIKRAYEMNTGLMKSFHRMMLMTVRR
ncbi:flagellar basal body rod protein FlgB [Pseudohoeflea coraliihabitans]|uniref:Flagellar basal body rod protein FlgB n=1 Tax=Pseudohoeflea coraliihabitans TaxID=2860393 RepID=A0ABS6WN49_9HYPH|nr:flagellar basal body rod protein FlgB [Pseudohoeflea sp. DP4N28-3]MBW3097374.1 flagellar basal body rod protein FlgB [Pseudohoeflea sp. DP4N28-3]